MFSPVKKFPMSPRTAAPLKGLFQDGIWMCNCKERLPAVKRETKKPGRNQGRFFWTCQNPPGKQCDFFLWADEAEVREKETLLSNSRSEREYHNSIYRTPTKNPYRTGTGLLTPQTERKVVDVPPRHFKSPPKSAKARMMAEDTDEFGWHDDSGDNEELVEALQSSQATEPILSQPNFNPESPYKAARTSTMNSPGKRKLFEYAYNDSNSNISPLATPSSSRSSRFPPSSAELCMTPTPSKYRNVLSVDSQLDMSPLGKQATAILDKHGVVLPNIARDELLDLLNIHELKLSGAIKGRDAVRMGLKKERSSREEEELGLREEIAKLTEENLSLKAHNSLHQDMMKSISE